jgi:hypothetical protein
MGKVKDSMMKSKTAAQKTRSIVETRGRDRDSEQAAIQMMVNKGFDAAVASHQTTVLEESGNVVQNKDLLVGVPMLILSARFSISKQFGTPFVSVTAMLPTNEVIIFNDGSTGICRQLEGLEISPEQPLHVPGGLRCSKYDYEDPQTGKKIAAQTYYLSGQRSSADIKGLNRSREPQNGRALRA